MLVLFKYFSVLGRECGMTVGKTFVVRVCNFYMPMLRPSQEEGSEEPDQSLVKGIAFFRLLLEQSKYYCGLLSLHFFIKD